MDVGLDRAAGSRVQFGSADLIGALVGIGIVGPLFGEIGGIPSRYLADLAILAAVIVAWRSGELRIAVSRNVAILFGLIAVYFLLVVASARVPQWAFLLHPSQWRGHADDYTDAKLLMFGVTFIGPVVGALVVIFSTEKETVTRAILWTVVAIGLIAICRLAPFYHVLVGTDRLVSRTFFYSDTRGFSTVMYGLLFLFAGIAALALRPARLLSAVFVAGCFILERRSETVMLLIAILTFYGYAGLRKGHTRALVIGAATVVVAGVLMVFFRNGGDIDAWVGLGSSIQTRAAIATGAVSSVPSSAVHFLFGNGLGSASTDAANWPHNLLLETYIESGLLTALVLVGILIWSAIISRLAGLMSLPPALCTAAITVAMFIFSMKSTDVTSAGVLVAWALITVGLGTERAQQAPEATAERRAPWQSRA